MMETFQATPVVDDLGCDLCRTSISADGAKACTECLAALDKIAEQAGAKLVGPNRAQRRAMKRSMRLHNNGRPRR